MILTNRKSDLLVSFAVGLCIWFYITVTGGSYTLFLVFFSFEIMSLYLGLTYHNLLQALGTGTKNVLMAVLDALLLLPHYAGMSAFAFFITLVFVNIELYNGDLDLGGVASVTFIDNLWAIVVVTGLASVSYYKRIKTYKAGYHSPNLDTFLQEARHFDKSFTGYSTAMATFSFFPFLGLILAGIVLSLASLILMNLPLEGLEEKLSTPPDVVAMTCLITYLFKIYIFDYRYSISVKKQK